MSANTLNGPSQVPVKFDGGVLTAPVASNTPYSRPGAGALVSVLVTATGTGVLTIYDNAAGNSTGTVIGIVPASTAVGTVLTFKMPALLGISMPAVASSPAVTLNII